MGGVTLSAAPAGGRPSAGGRLSDVAWLLHNGGVVVLSGAGISTESGIPDYRGPSGVRRRSQPMSYADFLHSPGGRRRYWARSHLGWPLIAGARPNDGHRAVAAWDAAGLLDAVITQNVDGLHQHAGARHVLDLHGRLDTVVCLGCSERSARTRLERRFTDANPTFHEAAGAVRTVNPDGDVDLPDALVDDFTVVDCERCGGLLKPDVVFFGESVPKERVQRAVGLVDGARALLVLGSSLTVMSGYRFVRQAHKQGTPVVVVNEGVTRGDPEATIKIDARLGPLLGELTAALAL